MKIINAGKAKVGSADIGVGDRHQRVVSCVCGHGNIVDMDKWQSRHIFVCEQCGAHINFHSLDVFQGVSSKDYRVGMQKSFSPNRSKKHF